MIIVRIIKMSVDKFGRYSRKSKSARGPPGIGFVVTTEGDFSMQHKRLKNLSSPKDPNDATTKTYVDNLHEINAREIRETTKKHDNLRTRDLRALMDVNSKADGILSALPGMLASKISGRLADPLNRISLLENNLEKYTTLNNVLRDKYSGLQQDIVGFVLTLTTINERMDTLEKAMNPESDVVEHERRQENHRL